MQRRRLRKSLTHPDTSPILLAHSRTCQDAVRAARDRSDESRKIQKISMVARQKPMWETCAVDLRVQLPRPVAAEVEEVQREDPEMLSRMLVYAVTRRTFYHQLQQRGTERVRYER